MEKERDRDDSIVAPCSRRGTFAVATITAVKITVVSYADGVIEQ